MKDQIFAIRRSMEGKKASQTVLELHGSREGPMSKRWSGAKKKSVRPLQKIGKKPDLLQPDLFGNN